MRLNTFDSVQYVNQINENKIKTAVVFLDTNLHHLGTLNTFIA